MLVAMLALAVPVRGALCPCPDGGDQLYEVDRPVHVAPRTVDVAGPISSGRLTLGDPKRLATSVSIDGDAPGAPQDPALMVGAVVTASTPKMAQRTVVFTSRLGPVEVAVYRPRYLFRDAVLGGAVGGLLCYDASGRAPGLVRASLVDRFGTSVATLKQVAVACVAVTVDGSAPADPAAAWVCYDVDPRPVVHPPAIVVDGVNVRATHQTEVCVAATWAVR